MAQRGRSVLHAPGGNGSALQGIGGFQPIPQGQLQCGGRMAHGSQAQRGRTRGAMMHGVCYNCGDMDMGEWSVLHLIATGMFYGYCAKCGAWGQQSKYCGLQQAHIVIDEFERADDSYPIF